MQVFVETKRFLLREIVNSDVDGLFELDSDPLVHQYLGNKPVSNKKQIEEVIAFIRKQYIENGIGRWAIEDIETGDFIGWTGLKYVTEITNGHQNFYDIGYRIIRKYWGQGIATETAIASLTYAFDVMNLSTVFASASSENIASNKILQKIGMEQLSQYLYEDILCNWYRIEKSVYEK